MLWDMPKCSYSKMWCSGYTEILNICISGRVSPPKNTQQEGNLQKYNISGASFLHTAFWKPSLKRNCSAIPIQWIARRQWLSSTNVKFSLHGCYAKLHHEA
jgi:hypothetical protein